MKLILSCITLLLIATPDDGLPSLVAQLEEAGR